MPTEPLSRRAFLAGLAGTGVLAACGGADDRTGRGTLVPLGEGSRVLVAGFRFEGDYLVSGVEQRMTFQIAAADGAPTTDVPETLTFRVTRDGAAVGDPVTVAAHRDGVPLPYFPLRLTLPDPGTYQAAAELDGQEQTQAFRVDPPDAVPLVQVGQPMRPVDTPTPEDPRGVQPICTREPACTLHRPTLTEALGEGRPVALLIGTPAYCQTGLCGPVLDLLLEQVEGYPSVRFLHAEVYADPAGGNLAQASLAPVVDAYGLFFEPSLVVAAADGTVAARLDNVYDRTELVTALDKVG